MQIYVLTCPKSQSIPSICFQLPWKILPSSFMTYSCLSFSSDRKTESPAVQSQWVIAFESIWTKERWGESESTDYLVDCLNVLHFTFTVTEASKYWRRWEGLDHVETFGTLSAKFKEDAELLVTHKTTLGRRSFSFLAPRLWDHHLASVSGGRHSLFTQVLSSPLGLQLVPPHIQLSCEGNLSLLFATLCRWSFFRTILLLSI